MIYESFFLRRRVGERKLKGEGRNAAISTLKPRAEISHAVTVVPMLAPIMTPMDWVNVKSPAFTKLTTITVVADDDWIRAVINTPVSIPVTLFVVIAVSIRRKLSPANFCNPSLMIFIPYKNSAKEPISRRKSKKRIVHLNYVLSGLYIRLIFLTLGGEIYK